MPDYSSARSHFWWHITCTPDGDGCTHQSIYAQCTNMCLKNRLLDLCVHVRLISTKLYADILSRPHSYPLWLPSIYAGVNYWRADAGVCCFYQHCVRWNSKEQGWNSVWNHSRWRCGKHARAAAVSRTTFLTLTTHFSTRGRVAENIYVPCLSSDCLVNKLEQNKWMENLVWNFKNGDCKIQLCKFSKFLRNAVPCHSP